MNLFVVESPLQLLNAQEAKAAFGVPRAAAVLVVFVGVSEHSQSLTLSLIKTEDWAEVLKVGPTRKLPDFLREKRLIEAWMKQHPPIETVFIGDYRARFMRHMANTYAKRAVLLDDGSATIKVAEQRARGEGLQKQNRGLKRLFSKQRLFGYHDEDIPVLTYFSVYDLPLSGGDQLQRHHYAHLKRKAAHSERRDEVWFIGSPMVEAGILSAKRYRDYLRQIASECPHPVAYVPHRREEHARVDDHARALGWRVQRNELPFELALVEGGQIPQALIGLYSTALDSTVVLFGEQIPITSYEIPSEDILIPERVEISAQVYQYYREHFVGPFFQIKPLAGGAN